MFPRNRTIQTLGAFILMFFVVPTLRAQEPEPTPEPTPICQPCEEAQLNEAILLRRLMVLLGGAWMGWKACTLIYSRLA